MVPEDEGGGGAHEAGLRRMIDAYQGGAAARVEHTVDRVLMASIPYYQGMSREMVCAAVTRMFMAVGEDLELGEPRSFPGLLAMLGAQRSQLGVEITQILAGLNIGFETTSEDLGRLFADDAEALIGWERARARIAFAGATALIAAYMTAREQVVRAQADEILRLSTQVLPLYRGILVCPLVGTIDAGRAQAIGAVLLATVSRLAARVVLIDISAVPVVGTEAAMYLSQMGQAVALLGARAVLVGTSPMVAQSMIAAGVELGQLTTLADLESGLEYGLALLGRTISAREGSRRGDGRGRLAADHP